MTYMSAEEVKGDHIEKLGPELGAVYHELYNECLLLHLKWHQFVQLYGSEEDLEVLNRAARVFFAILQDTLWSDTLLHITRLTAPRASRGKDNLTVQRLPDLLSDVDENFRVEVQSLVDEAVAAAEFAVDWRNRRIAHRDLALAINEESAQPLPSASRAHVDNAIRSICRIIERIAGHYLKVELHPELIKSAVSHDAESLIYFVRNGLEWSKKRPGDKF